MTTKKDLVNEINNNFDYVSTVKFIKANAGNRKTVLDTNSQSWTFLNLLQAKGFDVSGIVSSKKMQTKLCEKTTCKITKKSLLKLKNEARYDIITSLFSSCNKYKNYIQLDTALNKMNRCLNDDGIIILQLIKKVKQNNSNKNTLNEIHKINKRKGKVKVVNVYELDNRKFKIKSKFKLFDVEKVSNIAKKNGLKIVDVYRDYSVKTPDGYGDNMQIIFKKNTDETEKEAKKRKRQFVTKKGKIKVVNRKIYTATMILMACFGVLCGTWVGDFYNSTFADTANFNYSEEQVLTAVGDPSLIDASKSPDALGSVKAFMLAEYKSKQIENFSVKEVGEINASMSGMIVKQDIRGLVNITPNTRTRISASTGLMPVATKVIYDKSTSNLVLYKGAPNNLDADEFGTNWDGGEKMDTQTYRNKWGVQPGWFVPYVVCDGTVFSSTALEKNGDDYTATLTLKTRKNATSSDGCQLMAYTYYVKQIAEMSGVTVTDVESCNITFTLDSEYKFKQIVINEVYNIRYGVIPVTCPANLTQTFSYI